MPGQTLEPAFKTYVEEILLTRGGWQSGMIHGRSEIAR